MLRVDHLADVDAATWDALLAQSPGGGHVLQSYAWGEVKARHGMTPFRLALRDGARELGAAQLFIRRVPGVPGVVAYCPKGPWIDWSRGDHVRAMLAGLERVARGQGAMVLKVESELLYGPGLPSRLPRSIERPLRAAIAAARRLRNGRASVEAPGPDEEARAAEAREALLAARARQALDGCTAGREAFRDAGWAKSPWDMQFRTTMVVDLDREPEALLARMKSKWRYNVNLARRKGVTIEQDDSRSGRELLYEMHARTAARDGFLPRPRDYYLPAWETMAAAGQAHLFFACHEGRPLAGLLLFTFGAKAWYQVGASESEGRNLMPAHALQFHAMQWAQQRGCTYYDLVAIPSLETIGPRDPMWGLYVFKSGFGGRPVEWAGCMDKVLTPRGHAWEALEPLYYRLYRRAFQDIIY